MSISTLILILEGTGVLGVATLIFIGGHKAGRWSCRGDYPRAWDKATAAERQRWEDATGTTFDALAAWNNTRPPDADAEWEAWEQTGEVPSTEVLLTAASERLGEPRVPSVAEVDDLAAQWHAAHGHGEFTRDLADDFRAWSQRMMPEPGPPIVADLTGPAAWHYPGEDDVPTLTGHVVTPPSRDRTGPEWLQAQCAAMDSETDAYLRRMKADVALALRGITTGLAS